MDILIVLAILVVVIAVVLMMASGGSGKTLAVERKPLMTKREREALAVIEAVFPQHRIYPQVAMGALIKRKSGLSGKERVRVRNRFSQKIVDFVAEDRRSGELLLIELDDRTHDSAKDKQRDAITHAAGYRTIRIPAGTRLDPVTVRSLMADAGQQEASPLA